jgi:hypothetical protein
LTAFFRPLLRFLKHQRLEVLLEAVVEVLLSVTLGVADFQELLSLNLGGNFREK